MEILLRFVYSLRLARSDSSYECERLSSQELFPGSTIHRERRGRSALK
jgi:hypothetical protein